MEISDEREGIDQYRLIWEFEYWLECVNEGKGPFDGHHIAFALAAICEGILGRGITDRRKLYEETCNCLPLKLFNYALALGRRLGVLRGKIGRDRITGLVRYGRVWTVDVDTLQRLADDKPSLSYLKLHKPIGTVGPPIRQHWPRWSAECGELQVGSVSYPIAKQAKNIRAVLDALEAAGWPEKVNSPFHEPQHHHDALRSLNRRIKKLRFVSLAQGTMIGVTGELPGELPELHNERP